ncbi:Hypothetical protein GLP15_3060 [Giardia lamblia P15]|uniref:Uncharacterized protein n=1 Tax=Giardia intestinalis (strain P15) TaxID=658858 RepID=E1F937_GIAIA|nr:Hypothetical protein GLP15_3060 [Giardia lamblia P15]
MLLLFRALERAVNLPILHMDDMMACYTMAFQSLSLLSLDHNSLNISFMDSNSDTDLCANKSIFSNGFSNAIPLRSSTLQQLINNSLDLLNLATKFYDFLKFQARLHSEILALIYCIHRIKTWSNSSSAQKSNKSFHRRTHEYFHSYLSTSLQNINAMLKDCPLLVDAYLSKMVCISLIRQLELHTNTEYKDILRELLNVANSGIEKGSVLLALYDQVEYYSTTKFNGMHSESYLVYLTNTMKSLTHGLLLGWHTLRAYKVNLLRQLGMLNDACAEARELIKLTITAMQGEKYPSASLCTCISDTLTLEPLDLTTTKAKPLDLTMFIAQQTNFIPIHSKGYNGFIQPLPPFQSELDSSLPSFSSQNAIANAPTIKFPSLRNIYMSSPVGTSLPPEPESSNSNDPTNTSINVPISTNQHTSFTDKMNSQQKTSVRTATTTLKDLNHTNKSLSDTTNMGCPLHSISSKHLDYRLVYLLTILEAGYDDEAFEYLMSGVFRSRLFSRLKANLDYGTIYTTPKTSDYIRFDVQNDEKYHYHTTTISVNPTPVYYPTYYRHYSEGLSHSQQLENLSQECVDDHFTSDPQTICKDCTKRTSHGTYPHFTIGHDSSYNQYTMHSFLGRHNKLLTSILCQRAYKHINHMFTSKHSTINNRRSLSKFALGRLKPSTNFVNNLRMSFDPKLLTIISCYFSSQIRGPLSRVLFYGPYYQFKCTSDKPHTSFEDIQDMIDIISSSSHHTEQLQTQAIWFNYHTHNDQVGATTAVSYSTIDSPASTFLCTPETKATKSLLRTTPLTTVVATYTLLLLLLKRRATWANKLAHSIFAERMLGCNCARSSMLFNRSMNVMDLSMAWPKKCLHLKIVPSMLLTDLGVRPAIPSTKLLQLAFSTNPYVVEYLLAKAVLPSKAVLHGLTLLFDVSTCEDPDYFLAAQYPDEDLQFVTHRHSMRVWQDRYCKSSEEKQGPCSTDAKDASHTEARTKDLKKMASRLRLSERHRALFQLAQDQHRLEAAVYVSEFGNLWGSNALYLQIHILAEKLAVETGVMAGIPFSFYIRSLRIITLGACDECGNGFLNRKEVQLSSHGYLHIATLDFLLQAYVQYLQFETATTLKSLAIHTSIATWSYPTDIINSTDVLDIKDVKDTSTPLRETFFKRWRLIRRATLLQFKGYPPYLSLRSAQAMKELFYNLIFTHRNISTPDKPGMLSYVNPLLCLLNTNSQFLDVTALASTTTADKNGLLPLLQSYLAAFILSNQKELFSVSAIESQSTNIYFDMPILAIFFSLTTISILELKPFFAPGSLLLEFSRLTTFSPITDTATSTGLLLHSANDLSYYYINPTSKTKKHLSLALLNCMTFGILSKKESTSDSQLIGSNATSSSTATFVANRDAYKVLQDSTCDTLDKWLSTKVLATSKVSPLSLRPGSNTQHEVRGKRKPARYMKSSSYQHKRLSPSSRAFESHHSQNIDDILLSSFYIDDENRLYKSFLRNPGLALRLSRLQRTQYFGLATMNTLLEMEDIIERMLVTVNYSVSDLILIYFMAYSFDHTSEKVNLSYFYDSDMTLNYQCPISSFETANMPPIYYLIETGQDEVFLLLIERVISALSYRNHLSTLEESSTSSDCPVPPEEFCGYSFSLAEDLVLKVDHENNDVVLEADAKSPLLMYLAARRKVRLGPSSGLDLDALITPSIASFGGTHKIAIYEAQAKILNIPLSRAEMDTLYVVKTLSKQEIETCLNPLWANTVGSTKFLRNSIDSLVHCCYKGETLLHAASKRDHLQIIELILLVFPVDYYDLLRSFYAALLNHSSGALRLFLASPLHSSLEGVKDTATDIKESISTINTENPECKRLLQHSIAAASALSDMSNILLTSFSYDVNPLLKLSLGESLFSSLANHEQLANKLQGFQQLVSSNYYYSFLAWAHLIRTLRPFCFGTTGGVFCLHCHHTKLDTCKKRNLFKYLLFTKIQSATSERTEKGHQLSTTQKLLAQQCYFSGHSLHGCISLLLSANIDIRICAIQNIELYNILSTLNRVFVMEQLPIKTPEQRIEMSYPDHIVLLKYLSYVYEALGMRGLPSNNSNLNSTVFDRFCTPLSTPLIMAAQYGSPVCHMLCAIINSLTKSTTTEGVLGNPSVLRAYINHRDAYGLTALHHATILFIRAFVSIIKHSVLPIISLGLSLAASLPAIYRPETAIFDNEFACSVLASSRANIKALMLAGADPGIPDATGVRCYDRLIAMLLETNMILFPPGYVVERFHEDQPTDILMHLILWSEKHHKPSRSDATLNSDSSLTIRVPILIEAKHVNWREELVKLQLRQLQESGHLTKDMLSNDHTASSLALDLRVQINVEVHPKLSSVSSAMQVIIQSNCTRVISELSIVLSMFLGLPKYQDRNQVFPNGSTATSTATFTPTPAEIVPLPFCNISPEGIQHYLELWFLTPALEIAKQPSLPSPMPMQELLLWAYSLYSAYGLRECRFIEEFHSKWATVGSTFIPWDTQVYSSDISTKGFVGSPPVTIPVVDQLPPLLHSLSLESAVSRIALGNSRVAYARKYNLKFCNTQSDCQYLSAHRLRNQVWRRILGNLKAKSLICNEDIHIQHIDLDKTGSAIVDTITMSMSHTLLQSSLVDLPNQMLSTTDIFTLLKESLVICFHEEEVCIESEAHDSLCTTATYREVLGLSGPADDSVLLDFRMIFRRARILSILADSIYPRSTLLFCSPDDLCFPSAWTLSQCFTEQKASFELLYSNNCTDNLAPYSDELYTSKTSLLDTILGGTPQSTRVGSTSCTGRAIEGTESADKRTGLFTPNRLGFAKLQNKHI